MDELQKYKELDKMFEDDKNKFERLGVRILLAFQCIKCGKIFDRSSDLISHGLDCDFLVEEEDGFN